MVPRPQEARRTVGEAKHLPAVEEWEKIQRALAGDYDALSTFFARHRERLYGSAFLLLRNKEDAEDALQEGLLSAYLNLRSFEGRARFSTWLTRIVFNAAFMNHRRIHAHLHLPLDEIVLSDEPPRASAAIDDHPDPEQLLARVETRDALKKVINRLSPPLRSTLHLRYMEDLSTREAAQVESVRIGVIKSRVFRARRQLASLLDARDVNL
jgi:RNA polymerase sigma-70 factor (ECF subfamily)